MINHTTRHIQHNDIYADIDEELADLILTMWQHDIKTAFSCQEGAHPQYEGLAYIQFDDINEYGKFLEVLKTEWYNKAGGIHPFPYIGFEHSIYPVFKNNKTIFMISMHFNLKYVPWMIEKLNNRGTELTIEMCQNILKDLE